MDPTKHKILCVDDEINILNALKRLLRKEPYQLLTCTSGEEALELLIRNHDVDLGPTHAQNERYGISQAGQGTLS